jgi:WD40 repeat protein
VNAVAISPDGRLLASGAGGLGGDSTIKLWSLPEGVLLKTLQGHTNWVYALAISADGRLLASAGSDHTIKLWSLPEGALLKTLQKHIGAVHVAISPDGRLLASGGYRTIKLWSLPEGKLGKTLTGHTETVRAVAISPDGRLLASGSYDQTVKLWSLPEGRLSACLLDLAASPAKAKGVQYQARNEYGEMVTCTLPCGSRIPPGAVCTCNCVRGTGCSCVGHSYCSCVGHGSGRGGWVRHYWYPN